MTKLARPLLYGMALLLILSLIVLQELILGDSYSSSTAGRFGLASVAFGLLVTAEASARASQMGRGATGVAGLSLPAVGLLYTVLATGLWLLSPVVPVGMAIGFHLILMFAALFGFATWKLAEGIISEEDQHQKSAGAGREALLLAAKEAQRRLASVEDGEVKKGMSQVIDDITYADRNGSEATAGIEQELLTALKALDPAMDGASLAAGFQAIRDQLASRGDVLKSQK